MNKYSLQMKFFNLYCFYYVVVMWLNSKLPSHIQDKIQLAKLKKLVKKAYELPFYKKKFDKVGIKPQDLKTVEDLKKFPTLSKEEYREWMNEELKNEETKNYKLTRTSGSTGIPTTNIYPPKEYAQHYMMDMMCWIKAGYNPFWGKTLTCAPGDENVGQKSIIQRLGILRRECFSSEWSRDIIIDKINTYKPDFILGYSAELSFIAQYALDNRMKVHSPHYYCAGGEHVTGIQEKVLKSVFGEGMINYYGCTEMADFAYRLPGDDGYWTFSDCVALLVKSDLGISKYGSGSILATPLYRIRYPLINYEIGDNIKLIKKNGRDYISEMQGRTQDIFYWEDGSRTTHKDIWLISKDLVDIFQVRFIQDTRHRVIIQAVKDGQTLKTQTELEQYLVEKYSPCFAKSVEIVVQWFDEIPLDDSGKIRNMVSRIV